MKRNPPRPPWLSFVVVTAATSVELSATVPLLSKGKLLNVTKSD